MFAVGWSFSCGNIQAADNMKTLLLALAVAGLAAAYVDYTGYVVFRVVPHNEAQLQLLRNLQATNAYELDFWKEPTRLEEPVDMMVSAKQGSDFKGYLIHNRLDYSIHVRDVGQLVSNERDSMSRQSRTFSLTHYNSFADVQDQLVQWEKQYSSVSLTNLGYSTEGRPMTVLKVSEGSDAGKKAIWIDGGIHAREWISMATVLQITHRLLTGTDEITKNMRANVIWYILPQHNPDGYEYSRLYERMWRKTRSGPEYFLGRECYGVDPNRNWEYMWGGLGTSSNPCSDTYRGKRPFSEPETDIVAAFLKSHSNTIVAYLSFHSYGQWFLYPWGYDIVELEDWKDLDTLANDAASKLRVVYGTRYTVGNSAGLLYPAAGGSDDYAKSEGIKYAYTVELRDEGRYGFLLPANQIEPSGIETYEAIKVFGTCIAANNCPENVE